MNSVDDKNKIINQLKTENIKFFTHPENNAKTFKVILSGLPIVDTAYITASLTEQKITPT